MAKQFTLIEGTNAWGVMWSLLPRHLFGDKTLTEILFTNFDLDTATLLIELNNKETEPFVIDRESWQLATSNGFGIFLQDYYIINGVVFNDKQYANDFYDWIEKKQIWYQLKA